MTSYIETIAEEIMEAHIEAGIECEDLHDGDWDFFRDSLKEAGIECGDEEEREFKEAFEALLLAANQRKAVKAIGKATSLEELCAALNEAQGTFEYVSDFTHQVDLPGLETFGGTEPTNTGEVYSWDAESVLTYQNEWVVVSRADYFG